MVGVAGFEQSPNNLAIPVEPVALINRAFIRVQSQLIHPVEDGIDVLLGRSFLIRIFNAKNEPSPMGPGIELAKERSTHAADMKHSRWAGGKASSDCHWTD